MSKIKSYTRKYSIIVSFYNQYPYTKVIFKVLLKFMGGPKSIGIGKNKKTVIINLSEVVL